MGISSESQLKDILPDFQSFLVNRKLADVKHVRFYALRVSQFLTFTNRDKEREI